MARQAGKKQAPAKIEEDDDDGDSWDDGVVDDEKPGSQSLRLRDWRDVERFREMKELRSLVDDDYGLEEIFHIPVKPRAEPGIPAPHTSGKPAKAGAPAPKAGAAKAAKVPVKAPVKAPAKAPATPAKAAAKAPAKAPKKAPARLKAKAKRR